MPVSLDDSLAESAVLPARFVVTGASGLLGAALVECLRTGSAQVVGVSRKIGASVDLLVDSYTEHELSQVLQRNDVVVHCAGQTPAQAVSAEQYEAGNVTSTLALCRAGKNSGVRGIVLCSSITVYGNQQNLTASDCACQPLDDYGRSKYAAEQVLMAECGAAVEPVILRLPPILGAQLSGGLKVLEALARWRVPLPIGAFDYPRPVLRPQTLAAYLNARYLELTLQRDGKNPSCIVLLQEQPVLSYSQLLSDRLAKPVSCLPIPAGLLKSVLRAFGLNSFAHALARRVTIDDGPSRAEVGW